MEKTIKILTVVMMAVMIIFTVHNFSQAASASSIVDGIKPDSSTVDTTDISTMAGKVLGIIQVATAILAVILIAVFGFKFVLGSAQEKADYQKSFIPLIVGVVVVFAASSIAKMIFSIIEK